MLMFHSPALLSAFGFLLQTRETFRRSGDDAFFTGQVIGTFFVSRVLLAVVEVVVLLIVVKVLKLRAYVGIVIAAVVTFLLYLLPNLLLSGAGSIPGAGPEIAAREAATTQTNIMLMGAWLVVWVLIDCGIAFLVTRRSQPAPQNAP